MLTGTISNTKGRVKEYWNGSRLLICTILFLSIYKNICFVQIIQGQQFLLNKAITTSYGKLNVYDIDE